jgi:hypothetical protein
VYFAEKSLKAAAEILGIPDHKARRIKEIYGWPTFTMSDRMDVLYAREPARAPSKRPRWSMYTAVETGK